NDEGIMFIRRHHQIVKKEGGHMKVFDLVRVIAQIDAVECGIILNAVALKDNDQVKPEGYERLIEETLCGRGENPEHCWIILRLKSFDETLGGPLRRIQVKGFVGGTGCWRIILSKGECPNR